MDELSTDNMTCITADVEMENTSETEFETFNDESTNKMLSKNALTSPVGSYDVSGKLYPGDTLVKTKSPVS